jgi:NADH-quinone oxidoreductase subunit K
MSVLAFYLSLSAFLFAFGALGVIIRRNAIVVFMCVELMLNGVNLSLIAVSREYGNAAGQVYVFFVMAVAAAEAAVGLAIILAVFRNFYSIRTDEIQTLNG